MRVFGRLFTLFLLLALAVSARAESVTDFRMDVLDPPQPLGTFYSATSATFPVDFGQCPVLPGNNTADGCFVVQNATNSNIIGIQFLVPNQLGVVGQQAGCLGGTGSEAFGAANCPVDPDSDNIFVLTFTRGSIGQAEFFFITESGVPYADFPTTTANLTLQSVGTTPEPSSILLLSTGLLCTGCLFWTSRRRAER